MKLRIGQVSGLPVVLLAALLAVAGCGSPSTEAPPAPSEAPMLAMPRLHHDAMRARAEEYCAAFGGEPELVDWRYRSTFGKRGEWRMQTMWECRDAGA
jgi:hypothetical protein